MDIVVFPYLFNLEQCVIWRVYITYHVFIIYQKYTERGRITAYLLKIHKLWRVKVHLCYICLITSVFMEFNRKTYLVQ